MKEVISVPRAGTTGYGFIFLPQRPVGVSYVLFLWEARVRKVKCKFDKIIRCHPTELGKGMDVLQSSAARRERIPPQKQTSMLSQRLPTDSLCGFKIQSLDCIRCELHTRLLTGSLALMLKSNHILVCSSWHSSIFIWARHVKRQACGHIPFILKLKGMRDCR